MGTNSCFKLHDLSSYVVWGLSGSQWVVVRLNEQKQERPSTSDPYCFPHFSGLPDTSRSAETEVTPAASEKGGRVEPSFESLSPVAAKPSSGKNPAHSSRCIGTASPLQRQSLGNNSVIGVHLTLFWGRTPLPNPPLPRGRHSLTYQGRCSPLLRAGFWTPRSPALKAQAHVGAGRLTRKRLPYRPPLRERSLRSLRGSLRIHDERGWNFGQYRVSREPESLPVPQPPKLGSHLRWEGPRGSTWAFRASGRGPGLQSRTHPRVHMTVYSLPGAKIDCVAHW